MFRRQSDDVLPFELFPGARARPTRPPVVTDPDAPLSLQTFPICVRPAEDEALLSWLLRLATRLGVSLTTLARSCFGVNEHSERTQWWLRPDPEVLERIGQLTGMSVDNLRRMTFAPFGEPYREDESNERFCGRRYHLDPPRRREFRFVVCEGCLSTDREPYLRLNWLLGWVAVCPIHWSVMVTRCEGCGGKCRVAHASTIAAFSPATCTRCGFTLSTDHQPASPSVLRLQASMLKAKRDGSAVFEGLGELRWNESVALFDVLQGMFWTARTIDERQRDLNQYAARIAEEGPDARNVYGGRYGALRFLTWLTEDWANGSGSIHGGELLSQWFDRPRNRISKHLAGRDDVWSYGANDFAPAIKDRLRRLLFACYQD